MKRHIIFLRWLALPFVVTTCAILALTCSEKPSPTEPPSGTPATAVETAAMKQIVDSLTIAFKSEDKTMVLRLVNPEFASVFAGELNTTTASLSLFGTALEQRQLVAASPLYAEYEIVVQGQAYRLAIANCGDGKWQMVR